jgi:hypothetical protein
VNLYYRNTPSGSSAIADLFISTVSTYGIDLAPAKYNVAQYTIGNQSDNKSFWDQGYPAILVIEDYQGNDFTPSYHTVNDRWSTLDLDYFTSMVEAAVGTFAHMTGCLIPDAPISVDIANPSTTDIALSWYQTAPNASYEVWHSSDPYFVPDTPGLDAPGIRQAPALGVAINYTDSGAGGDPAANRFYVVRGIAADDTIVATSQPIGEFTFALESGTPAQ